MTVSILCRTPGPRHHHASSADARACWVAATRTAAPAPRPAPPVAPGQMHQAPRTGIKQVIHVDAEVTEGQLYKVRKEGGDPVYAAKLTRGRCSQYIQDLIKAKENRPVQPPAPVTIVPLMMLNKVRPGWYAWRSEEGAKWHFVRISRPTRGNYAGTTKIQTQHGPSYKERFVVRRDGSVKLDPADRFIEPVLLGIIVNQRQAAMDYARLKHRCCRCNTELTLGRSQYYRIGSECEKIWPDIIQSVEDETGPFVPGVSQVWTEDGWVVVR